MESSAPYVVDECIGLLQVYSDGTVTRRSTDEIISTGIPSIHDDPAVVFKDYIYDTRHNLSFRLYKPKTPASVKLPIVLYFHGGGFCLGSCVWPVFHNPCLRLASGLGVALISADYRLAPEHRLPAAIDDAVTAMEWLRGVASGEFRVEWLSDGDVDFERVFVAGDSAGANIVHQLAVRLGMGSPKMAPVTVKGYVMFSPFFGGVERMESEEGPPEPLLNLEGTDRLWRLALPVGENRDHPMANPFGASSPSLEPVALVPILVIAGGNEILKDRIADYVRKLHEMGKKVEYSEFEGRNHCFFAGEPYSEIGDEVVQVIKRFMNSNS